MELGDQECRDYLLLIYGIDTPDLPDHCNVCGAAFYICQALDCKKRGLVAARHNKFCGGVADLEIKDFNTTHVRGDPEIYTGCAVRGGKEKIKGYPPKDKGGLKGDILIRDLWTQGTGSIHDMHDVNTDATSY